VLHSGTLGDVLEMSIVALDTDLALPSYARVGDAGLDLLARESVVLGAGERYVMPTGIAIAIPAGYAGFVLPRSGLAARFGVSVVNSPGLIDAGYRDEIKVALLNTDRMSAYAISRGDRVAQLVIQRVEEVKLVVVEGFEGDHRGGGFGHTGR
jgi:dUTP pyrophosphatase